MKFLFVILFSLTSSFALEIDPHVWEQTQDSKDLQLYRSKEIKGYYLSVKKSEVKNSHWQDADATRIIKEHSKTKVKMLSFLGIKNWKLDSHKWSPSKEESTLELLGTYTNKSGQKVEFKEVHIFNSNFKTQYLYTKVIP